MGRGEQPVDDLGEGVGRLVGEEGGDLFRRRGKAGEVEVGAAQEVALVGGLDGLEALLLEVSEDETVDLGAVPAGILHGGSLGIGERLQRPEGAALGRDRVLASAVERRLPRR